MTKIAYGNGTKTYYLYNELNRLVYAKGSYGEKTYVYDEIGNITRKGDLNYFYESSRPHAVTSVTGTEGEEVFHFEYDENGNTVSMSQRVKT